MTTNSFKQFLFEGELSELALELFFRHHIHLSKDAARKAIAWYHKAGTAQAIPVSNTPDDWWDHLVDWAEERHAENNAGDPRRKSLFDLASGATPMPLLVKGVLAKELRKKKLIEGYELRDLKFMLALRKEYELTKEQAYEVMEWLRDDKDWQWLSDGVRQSFYDIWDPDTPDRHPGMSYGDFVADEIHLTLKKHYQLDTRDLLG